MVNFGGGVDLIVLNCGGGVDQIVVSFGGGVNQIVVVKYCEIVWWKLSKVEVCEVVLV